MLAYAAFVLGITTAFCAIMNEVNYDDDIGECVVWDVNDIDYMWGVASHWWWLPYSLQVTRSITRGAFGRPRQKTQINCHFQKELVLLHPLNATVEYMQKSEHCPAV